MEKLDLKFKAFIRQGRPGSQVDGLSIMRNRRIGLLAGFMKKYNIGRFKYVVLSYDETNKAVGLAFTSDEKREGIYRLNPTNGGATITPLSFWSEFNIDPKYYAGRYIPEIFPTEFEDIFYFILGKKVEASSIKKAVIEEVRTNEGARFRENRFI